jgi:hypothetical protein
METKRMRDGQFQVRGTLPGLTTWSCFGYTTREEAEGLIKAMKRDGWTCESRGVNNKLTDDWLREADAPVDENGVWIDPNDPRKE